PLPRRIFYPYGPGCTERLSTQRIRMNRQYFAQALALPARRLLALAALAALPLSLAIAADGPTPATTPSTTQAAASKPAEKKEDPKAWKVAENWKFEILLQKPK